MALLSDGPQSYPLKSAGGGAASEDDLWDFGEQRFLYQLSGAVPVLLGWKLPGMDWYDECMWHLNILMHVSI